MIVLFEDNRQQLINKAKAGADYKGDKSKGRNRYARRTHSKISSNVKSYNDIDMNSFFHSDTMDFKILIHGETDDYYVRLQFNGVLDNLKDEIAKNNGKFEFKVVVKSLKNCFNKNDVYVFCECPDWEFRFGYWASVKDIIAGDKEDIPSDITNPNNTLGPCCKHVCLVLTNLQWVYKLAATIHNYINYMESHYKQAYKGVIYPKLYGKDYELEPEQQNNPDFYKTKSDARLGSDKELINKINDFSKDKGKFKPGNTQGVRFAKNTGNPIIDDEGNET